MPFQDIISENKCKTRMKMCRTFDSSTAHSNCASRMRIDNIHAANRWSDSEQSRVRARVLPVGENGFRVDNNELCWLRYLFIGCFSRADVIESMSFYDGRFRWKSRPKKRLPTHFSASKFNWPGGPATMWFNWPDPKIYWPGPTDPRLRKALTFPLDQSAPRGAVWSGSSLFAI